MRRHFCTWLAVLAACLLCSCIDGREEYWFQADGGGRAELTYSLPAVAAEFSGGEDAIREKIATFLNGNEAFTHSSHEVVRVGDRLRVTVRVAFRSVQDLQKLSSRAQVGDLPDAARGFTGDIHLEMKGTLLDFTRRISPGKAMPGAIFLPKRELEGRQLSYTIHLPVVPQASNATRTEDGGRTLIWEVPLAQALRQPIVTHFQARIPLPRWLLPAALGCGVLLAWGIWRWRKRRFSRLRVPVDE